MRRRSRREEWVELLALKNESDKTIKAFCEEFGVAVHQFYYWRKRLREESDSTAAMGFVRIEMATEEAEEEDFRGDAGLVVDLQRLQLRLERGFDESSLQRVLNLVGGLRC